MLTHYVDDYNSRDTAQRADSGFDSFNKVCDVLGVQLKKSKAQRPARARDTLGVELACDSYLIQVRPKPSRRQPSPPASDQHETPTLNIRSVWMVKVDATLMHKLCARTSEFVFLP